ncbi:protein tyrosine phosphatase type IVA 3 isoform X1 [Alosa pseudoharengus]|uniref:protein tyrosine phosphatase type IVA 3 isoform X1 n=1 Tax=Alosa pseudoharengus TaxID=34774 RepID=UPI003F8C155E
MARMNRPAPVEVCYKNMRFLITHNPTNSTLNSFIEVRHFSSPPPVLRPLASLPLLLPRAPPLPPAVHPPDLKKYGATTVVRVCEVTYDKAPLEKDGITVVDWPFDDGAPPPSKVVEDWLSLLRSRFLDEPGCCVAVHCVAGLGRAPVLVALALIESGMKYEDAIQFIRQKRRGAINSKQLTYLEKYRPKQRLRYKHPHIFKNKCCIM